MTTILHTAPSVPTPAGGIALPAPLVHVPWCAVGEHDAAFEEDESDECSSAVDVVSTDAGQASGWVVLRDGSPVIVADLFERDVQLSADEADRLAGLLYRLADVARRNAR